MEEDLNYIKAKLQCYLEIIFKEYGNYIKEDTKKYLYSKIDYDLTIRIINDLSKKLL